jgi:predicted PurR-regulated permease PerM
MNTPIKMPFYAKAALIFISLFSFVYTLYIGQHIIVPIVYALIIAILLNPLVNYLMKKRVSKIIAISIAVLVTILVMLGFVFIISTQISMFSETYPQLKGKFYATKIELIHWVADKFKLQEFKINKWVKETQADAVGDFEFGEKLTEAGRLIMIGTLLPVYLFMILYYKPLLLEFIRKLFKVQHHLAVAEVLASVKKIIQSYLVGLFFEMIIVSLMNSIGLLLLGIDYAIILGITGAILNVLPYIGGIIAIALPMVIAFITKDTLISPLLVFLVYIFIQFIDNHYLIPKIVASRVQINALISVVVVLIGGALWGISGMFLSIPLTAILKVIFDHIHSLKPWGFLLGNVVPTASKFSFARQKKV